MQVLVVTPPPLFPVSRSQKGGHVDMTEYIRKIGLVQNIAFLRISLLMPVSLLYLGCGKYDRLQNHYVGV